MGVSLLCVNSEKIEKHQVYKGLAEKKSNKQVEIKDCSQATGQMRSHFRVWWEHYQVYRKGQARKVKEKAAKIDVVMTKGQFH